MFWPARQALGRFKTPRKKGFSGGLPARRNATIRSPVAAWTGYARLRPTRHLMHI